ncbi:MAG: glycerate kinase [Candidatus Nephthysia bennettiae]|nr:glycerate kinase [Candidatus Dormibacteraeota bacterium]PZR97576.1 MAG: glycerate kinase [Candidatus Dormibacteraeota bacterium]
MRIVAAPNPYKGSLTAPVAAGAIKRGVLEVWRDAEVLEVPVADGGEGTVDALVAAHGGERVTVTVEGPLGDPVEASFGLIDGGRTAVVELAAASGLPLVPPGRLDPRTASTYGFGQLLEAARKRAVTRVIAGIGGSATNDGGAGMAQALGYRLLDVGGDELPRGGAALRSLARIDASAVDPSWREVEVSVACDVTNPLYGPEGATAVYGPQKGVTPELMEELDGALARLAEVIAQDVGVEVAGLPGAGAAGGSGAGLVAFVGARLLPGAPLVVEAAGLDSALSGSDLVFGGEGRVDGQTVYGKGPIEVARRARQAGVPTILLAGQLGEGWQRVLDEGVSAVLPLALGPGTAEEMIGEASGLLAGAAERACRLIAIGLGVRS